MHEPDKKARLKLAQCLAERMKGSNINCDWRIEPNISGIWMHNSYFCQGTHSPNSYAEFSIFLPWRESLLEFRVYFHKMHSQHKARVYGLREYLNDTIHAHLRAIADQYAGEERSKEFIKNLAFEIATYQEARSEHRNQPGC